MKFQILCCFAVGAFSVAFSVSAQDVPQANIVQSRGLDQRLDYNSLTRFGPWDDRNYALTEGDMTWLAPNEEELHPNIPVFFRVELRKEWPYLQRSGPAQYPRAARQLFKIRYGGIMRNGEIHRPGGEGDSSRTPVTTDGEIKLSDVLGADEITVEINPANPAKVIAGANNSGGTFGQKMFYSGNSGQTWSIGEQGVANGVLDSTCCDPTVGWSSDGTIAYAAALNSAIGVNFYRSTNFGATWSSPNVLTASGSDKEFLHVDISPTSPYQDNVYLTWHDGNVMQFARSTDLGVNFTIKAFNGAMGHLVNAPSGIGSDITTDKDGRVFYVYASFGTITLLKSASGGDAFQSPITVATTNANFDYPIPSMETRRAWTYAAVDADRSSGPFAGNVYVAWTDTTAPDDNFNASLNHTQIIVARSSDRGVTWQTSIPHPTADVNTVDRFNQWLTVDENGIVHVVFYDTRHSVSRTGVDLYYANSDDGGVTWNTAERVSTVTSVNLTNGQEWGDYNGVSVVNGQIITTWTDNRPPTSASASDVYTGLLTLQLGTAQIWVDFAFAGTELGTLSAPYNTLAEGVAAVDTGGVIRIRGDTATSTSSETLTIAKAMSIQAVSGAISVGVMARSAAGAPLYLQQLDRLRTSYGLDAVSAPTLSGSLTGQTDDETEAPVLPFTIDDANDGTAPDTRAMSVRLRAPRSENRTSIWASANPKSSESPTQDIWTVFRPVDTDFLEGVIALTGAVGETQHVSAPENYEKPLRVWLPLPNDVPSNLVSLFYYQPDGPEAGWRLAEEVENWLVKHSEVRMTVDGVTYLGFLVRHAGIAQLTITQ